MEFLSIQEKHIDLLVSLCHCIDVGKLSEIRRLFVDQLLTESAHLRSLTERESFLRSAVKEYREVVDEIKLRRQRRNQLAALIGFDQLKKQNGIDPETLNQLEESVTRVALWPAIALTLEQRQEMRIVELHQELQKLGFKVSRQAVESAIDYHKDTFQTRTTEKRERFVSLR
jgi:hypothetical protein